MRMGCSAIVYIHVLSLILLLLLLLQLQLSDDVEGEVYDLQWL